MIESLGKIEMTDKYDWQQNPIFADRVPTRALTSCASPEQPKKKSVPAAVGRIIGELGLRYRPSLQADLEAHAESLKLLAEDVADVPPHVLERAAKQWAQQSRFMPKASELIELAQRYLAADIAGTDAATRQLNDHCNFMSLHEGNPRKLWVVAGEAPNRRIDVATH